MVAESALSTNRNSAKSQSSADSLILSGLVVRYIIVMRDLFLRLLHILVAVTLLGCLLTSCEKENIPSRDEDKLITVDTPEAISHVTILYAINYSSLSTDFESDAKEIATALTDVGDDFGRFLVFVTDDDGNGQTLYRAARNSAGKYTTLGVPVKTYTRDLASTSPERMAQVLDDALALYPNATFDLFLWGHGSSWWPEFDNHLVTTTTGNRNGALYAYGGEYTDEYGNRFSTDYMDIDELATAIPDGKFRYIWFDCCYMSSTEVLYQLRNKADHIVAYPTEIWAEGLAYDLVIPYVFSTKPNLKMAAIAAFKYYNDRNEPVTICVSDMSAIEDVADVTARIYALDNSTVTPSKLMDYSTDFTRPCYDFGQYASTIARNNGREDLATALLDAIDRMTVYRNVSKYNFKYQSWDTSAYSGLSTHVFVNNNTSPSKYYKTLDWYQRTYNH